MESTVAWLSQYLLLLAIPGFVALLLVELFVVRGRQAVVGYERRDTAASLAMGAGNVVIGGIAATATLLVWFAAYQHRIFDIPLGAWWGWVLLLFAEDFCYYWFHRFSHRTRFGWAAHVNHHSSQHYNLSTALRQSWTTPFYGFVFWIPLAFIGFHPLAIVVAHSVNLIYQFWIHTETIDRLGPLEWVLNTPSHHRVHHGTNPQYIDKNYGGIFIIWDRLFGSFEPEGERVTYGLTKNITSFNPIVIAFHAWRDLLRDMWQAPGTWQALKMPWLGPESAPDEPRP